MAPRLTTLAAQSVWTTVPSPGLIFQGWDLRGLWLELMNWYTFVKTVYVVKFALIKQQQGATKSNSTVKSSFKSCPLC